MARACSAELFMADGRQRRAGSLSVPFWNGYNGQPLGIMEPAGSIARAAYMAGKTYRREQPGVQRPGATAQAKVVSRLG